MIIYDGRNQCANCGNCPVVDLQEGEVVIYDPDKPDSGSFRMSVNEWNTLLQKAKPVSAQQTLIDAMTLPRDEWSP